MPAEPAARTVALAAADPAGPEVNTSSDEGVSPEADLLSQLASGRLARAQNTPAPEVIRHTVQPNDSLIKIARAYYGPDNGKLYRQILQANKDVIKDESVLLVGQVLRIPPAGGQVAAAGQSVAGAAPSPSLRAPAAARRVLLQAEAPKKPSGRVYVVRRGDNLTKIARRTLHDDSRSAAMKIFKANRDKLKNPNHLPVGLELEIPI